jgi:hypothetical protein
MSVRNLLPIGVLLAAMSIGCTGSPTAADGTVSITQTTSTTTTIPIPKLSAGAIGTSPTGTGLAAATVFTFLFVTPPSGGVPPYTFAWNFGDGAAGAAGSAPAHLFMNTGSFTATATVTDTMGTSAAASMPVSIRSVSGRWTVSFGGAALNTETIDIVQNQTAVTAAIDATADGLGAGTGSVSNPRSLSITATFAAAMPAPYAVTFVGTLNDTLTTWTGTVAGYGVCPCTFTATRSASAGVLGVASSPSFRR